jgi:hypothetical protein
MLVNDEDMSMKLRLDSVNLILGRGKVLDSLARAA